MAKAEFYECPGCGASVSPEVKKCEYCDNPVIIHSIGVISAFSPLQLNKYAVSYRKQLESYPDDRELSRSIGICYLKLKLYDKANEAFERAITDNFEDADSYFYAAVGKLKGKKAFVAGRVDIDKAIEYLNAANMIAPNSAYYLLLAYIKKDYFDRKGLYVSPSWIEELSTAKSVGATNDDVDALANLLAVEIKF